MWVSSPHTSVYGVLVIWYNLSRPLLEIWHQYSLVGPDTMNAFTAVIHLRMVMKSLTQSQCNQGVPMITNHMGNTWSILVGLPIQECNRLIQECNQYCPCPPVLSISFLLCNHFDPLFWYNTWDYYCHFSCIYYSLRWARAVQDHRVLGSNRNKVPYKKPNNLELVLQ